MHRRLTVAIALLLFGLATLVSPASAAGLFSATGNVIAILDGELFVGEAEGHLNGAGTLSIRSQKNPALTCAGNFTSSAGVVATYESSPGTARTFCSRCGTRLTFASTKWPGETHIPLACFDTPVDRAPSGGSFVEEHPSWIVPQ